MVFKEHKTTVILLVVFLIKISQGSTEKNNSTRTYSKVARGKFLFNELGAIVNFLTGTNNDVDDQDEDYNPITAKNCSCECGLANHENRIVGGMPSGVNRYPWIARIVYEGRFHCGGSLLTEDYVLTAAHCVRRVKRSSLRVILGDHDQSTTDEAPAKMRAVAAIVKHYNFDTNTYNHDIALLKLRKKVKFTDNIKPICLTKPGEDPAGKIGTVVGWGRTMEGGMIPNVIQEVQVPILTLAQCRAMKYRASRITSYMVCAGKGAQDSCQGDSGGPLVVSNGNKYEIVGIVSWGVGCGRPGYPGVYTRVSRYVNWIETNIEDSCLCS